MPRYYFHIKNGFEIIEDPEGIELPSVMIAKAEAEEAAREILASKVRSGEIIDGKEFEIRDAWGNRVATRALQIGASPEVGCRANATGDPVA